MASSILDMTTSFKDPCKARRLSASIHHAHSKLFPTTQRVTENHNPMTEERGITESKHKCSYVDNALMSTAIVATEHKISGRKGMPLEELDMT